MANYGRGGGRKLGPVGRRRFLALAGATTAALTTPPVALPGSAAEPVSGAGLALAFRHQASAIAIGRRYLERFPSDPHREVLGEDRRLAGETARSALRARVKQDFERGDTVTLDGWILSRSECRACAALALTAGAADRGSEQ